MKFGMVRTSDAAGHTLAHSLTYDGVRLPKGRVLTDADINELKSLGITEVTVAQLDIADTDENTAAAQLASPLEGNKIRQTEPFSGRVNLIAKTGGILRVNADHITAFNAVDEAITIATLPDYARVFEGTLLATIKIIPYAAPANYVEQALQRLTTTTLQLHPMRLKKAH